MKSPLAFIDNEYHIKTRSSFFMREILRKQFDISDLWHNEWWHVSSLTAEDLNAGGYHTILCWQTPLKASTLQRVSAQVIWAPMLDDVINRPKTYWLELVGMPLKIICFSRLLFDRLMVYGFDCIYVQYFLDPSPLPICSQEGGPSVFFWQRKGLTPDHVLQIIGDQAPAAVTVKIDPDADGNWRAPTMLPYPITVLRDFLPVQDYYELLSQHNVFVAPREYEGIGMSFLEAMTMGMAVAAINKPTMNEYIHNGTTGYLFDLADIRQIDLGGFREVGRRSRAYCEEGWKGWPQQEEELMEFIKGPISSSRADWRLMTRAHLWRLRKKLRKWKLAKEKP